MHLEALGSGLAVHGPHLGIMVAVLLAGLRHGFDLDHIAAITDITSSQNDRSRSLLLSSFYALGHASVLLVLGTVAVLAGARIPDSVDGIMGRVIGATLILLGAYVVYAMVRFRRDFRLRSRWMLLISGVRRTVAWLRRTRPQQIEIVHEHEHDHAPGRHGGHRHPARQPMGGSGSSAVAVVTGTDTHSHTHSHVLTMPDDPFADYGTVTAFGVGMLHGVGAETPSQMILLTAAAGVAGAGEGVLLTLLFVAGLLAGNTVLALATSYGFSRGRRLPVIFTLLAASTAVVSVAVGILYVLGRGDLLPGFAGG